MILVFRTQNKKEILDITDKINFEVKKYKIQSGLVHLFLLHTTAALTTADLDPGTDLDMLDAFEYIIPKLQYRHPHNPSHVGDHIMSSLIGNSIILPIENKELVLGVWQRLVLVEFNGPKERKLFLKFIKD